MTQQNHGRGAGRNRLELCLELVNQAMKCLSNEDRECVVRLIEELVRANCHDGRLIGKEVANKVKELVHELWLVSNHEEECRLLRILRDLGVSKKWAREATHITSLQHFNKRLERCGIDWENKAVRYEVVKEVEDLLKKEFSWSEVRMCEELWRFVGVDVDEFRKYGIEPCAWFEDLESLRDLRRPYWFGLKISDMAVTRYEKHVELELKTTNSIDAVFFVKLLDTAKTPSLKIRWERTPAAKYKYVSRPITLTYYIEVNADTWPWPIELSADKLEKILNDFSDKELVELVAGAIDGDGTVQFEYKSENGRFRYIGVFVQIAACENCPKSMVLNVLREVIAKRFGIIGNIYSFKTANTNVLVFYGRNAIKLLRRVAKYVHHPLKRLRIELILALYDGRISLEKFEELYEMIEYERGRDDIKRNRGLEALTRAAPQTHTHGN